ncbi:hypothetical protein HDU82_006040 [Entophlyctis luteolus]|nr:hypothetical protein HDU82_006040 [Entophlyctis luteolus]
MSQSFNINESVILLTGGAGFIGSHMVHHLVHTYPGCRVYSMDKLEYCSSMSNLDAVKDCDNHKFIKGDITSADFVNYIISEHGIDTIMHFAAQSHVDNSFGDSFEFSKSNILGTHVLLEASRTHGIKRFIHVSTDEVYGEVAKGEPNCIEDRVLAPTNPYAATKAAAESLVMAYHKSFKIPVVITRSNNIYGPNQYPEKVIPKFICSLLNGRKCNSRHYLHVSDLTKAMAIVLEKGEIGQTYNIGTDLEVSNLQLARFLLLKLGLVERRPGSHGKLLDSLGNLAGTGEKLHGEEEFFAFVEDRPFNDRRYAIDSQKMHGLGWQPEVGFEEGIAQTIEWYGAHWDGWWDEDVAATSLVAHPGRVILRSGPPLLHHRFMRIASQDQVDALLRETFTAETSDEVVVAARALARLSIANPDEGVRALFDRRILATLLDAAKDKKSGLAREGAMLALAAIFSADGAVACAPLCLKTCAPIILDLCADKGAVVREAAVDALNALFALPSPEAVKPHVLPILFEHGLPSSRKWHSRVATLNVLKQLAQRAPEQIGASLVELIPAVSECIDDTRTEVSETAYATMTAICSVVGNQDLAPKIPILVDCIAHPNHITECIQKLSSTTFVAEVNGTALAILVPILVRALNERSMVVQRQTVIIINNLCKLVRDPAEAGQFLPLLLPGIDTIIEMAAFPEVRALATAARNTLVKAGGDVKKDSVVPDELKPQAVLQTFLSIIPKVSGTFIDALFIEALEFISPIASAMFVDSRLSFKEWTELDICSSLLTAFIGKKDTDPVIKAVLAHYTALEKKRRQGDAADVDDGVEEICNCDFSLAYGGMMLLNHTNLTLKRGMRYGLCGANGAGKSTLMRAIATGKVEGFPSPEQLRTVMVEHALQGEDATLPIVDFIQTDNKLAGKTQQEISAALSAVGFSSEMQKNSVGSLSGGWKMKLELARAMLLDADVLLLDEPTNHLDVGNIKWLEEYLNSQTRITSVIVSHDSSFLDNICTHIIHYERKKLVYYKGNLSEFVKVKPEAKSYYTLSASQVKFSFPPPTILTGIKSATKAILYMNNVNYQYPGASKMSLSDVSVSVSLSSRVGIVGKNGAGKSTLIKVLLGELQPSSGTVWKHPNLRVGYVAQHAFHHLEQHLDLTPNKYLQWRYANGDDREVHAKVTRVLTEEDKKQMSKYLDVVGTKRQIEYIIGRQKLKKSFQYEIKWVGHKHKFNTWLPRERLIDEGFTKIHQEYDDNQAAPEGLGDIADFNMIGGLSGGQKVKVVIAAALWQNPHILVFDEPTNYLDRDSLGGLAVAIRDWGGGVVMISHNDEFLSALCPELWLVDAGRLVHKGKSAVATENFEDHAEEAKKIEAKIRPKKKKLTRNQLKEREVRRRERHLKWLIEGGEKPKDSDSD